MAITSSLPKTTATPLNTTELDQLLHCIKKLTEELLLRNAEYQHDMAEAKKLVGQITVVQIEGGAAGLMIWPLNNNNGVDQSIQKIGLRFLHLINELCSLTLTFEGRLIYEKPDQNIIWVSRTCDFDDLLGSIVKKS